MTAFGGRQGLSKNFSYSLQVLILAVWFGLLTGLGEVSILAIAKFFLNRYVHQGAHVVWAAPAADVFVFAIPGLILSFLAWRWLSVSISRIAVFVFAFLAFLSLLFMVTWLHKYAALLLATGLAVQSSRLIGRHPVGFYLILRRTVPWLIILILGMGVGIHGGLMLVEYRTLAKLPLAPPNATNVILIVLDTVRAQSLSLYGYARPTTPHLKKLAKKGVVFERAISTAPWTLPSHASMFTGLHSFELSTNWAVPLENSHPTLAGVLGAYGYLTAGFVANTYYCSRESGLNHGFAHYEDYSISMGNIILSSSLARFLSNIEWLRHRTGYYQEPGRKVASDVIKHFFSWLSRRGPQRPFFAFINLNDAHTPYLPPPHMTGCLGLNNCGKMRAIAWDGIGHCLRSRQRSTLMMVVSPIWTINSASSLVSLRIVNCSRIH